ncbi:hypothetical protein PtB15_14B30 [Puccinia triticina]|nr:hypothetical protein PtB15_14B30 [Puccinia triticina]
MDLPQTVNLIQTMDLPASGQVTVADCKECNFEGLSTAQALGTDSDGFLRSANVFEDPFRRGKNVLVLVECYNSDRKPLIGNCNKITVCLELKFFYPSLWAK